MELVGDELSTIFIRLTFAPPTAKLFVTCLANGSNRRHALDFREGYELFFVILTEGQT